MGIFDNAVSVIIGNKIVDSITTSDNGVIYQRSEHTRLSIDVPLNLTYSDAFNITGHLTTANGTGISGEQVLLKVGNRVMDSTTTGNNGEYSFTQTPVSSGTHLFQVVYAGSNTYGDSESSIVTRDVNKETTVLTATPDKQKYDIGDTVVLTVGFTDDEGNNISNVTDSIRLRINYDGAWRTIPHMLEFQSNGKIRIKYQDGYNSTWELRHEETNNYAYSHINIPLNIVTPTLISASATNQVITSGDSTTVTATLLDQDGDAIPNRTLSYNVKHGSTVLDTGSATTDSNGQISVSYTGTAVGQVDFEFSYGNLLQETYEVLDCISIDNGTQSDHNDNCWIGTGKSVMVRNPNYTTLKYEDALKQLYLTGITDSCVVDFEIQRLDSAVGNGFLNIFSSDYTISFAWFSLQNLGLSAVPSDWLSLRLKIESDKATLTLLSDPTKTSTKNYTSSGVPYYMRLIVNNAVTEWNIRNVRLYPI